LIIDRGENKAQYGIIQHFKWTVEKDEVKEFLNINVHLHGGKSEKD
jgi:hypothetical protein